MGKRKDSSCEVSAVFKVGAISLAFLVVGYQSALFIHKAAVLRIEAHRDAPDTVFVVDEDLARRVLGGGEPLQSASAGQGRERPKTAAVGSQAYDGDETPRPANGGNVVVVNRAGEHSETVERVRKSTRKVETFRFNPNTVSVEDLQRLGFSEKQALSIDSYRQKGGRFRRKSDFAASYVVADSVFARLRDYIVIPRTDINKADSAAFDELPGIGPYFAAKMVSYREELGGYSYPEQLMDIYRFDREKYDALSDLISCSAPARPFALWTLPAEELRKHPYIRSWDVARAIVLYRENNPPESLTVAGLAAAGVLSEDAASKLSRCVIQ